MSDHRPTSRTQTLVLAGHGSQRHPLSSAPLYAHADRIRSRGGFEDVRVALWREEPSLSDVASTIETDAAFVVPVLSSEGYFTDEVFPRELGIGGPVEGIDDTDGATGEFDATYDGPAIYYAEPVGTHHTMTAVVEDRVESARTGPAAAIGVALVGHGTERNERSATATKQHADRLRERARYAEVAALFLDESPRIHDLYAHLDEPELVVVPVFVADGHHTTSDVPDAIGHPGVGESARIDGRLVHYTGAVGTEPRLADVIVQRAVEAGAKPSTTPPTHWRPSAEEAFVRWLAASDRRGFGELVVDVRTDSSELRHRSDADAPPDALQRLDDPIALREHVRHDDRGWYRPLSGARSLPTGWVLDGLGESAVVRAIKFVYPGSIAHWHRVQTDTLAVSDFRETAARQTGRYADLPDLDGAELDAAGEAVCGTCVRRRQWKIRGEDPIEPVEDDQIPCREACPFFLSAAHAFRESDGETASDPDLDIPAGALENPANEYRVRYARELARHQETDASALPPGGDGR